MKVFSDTKFEVSILLKSTYIGEASQIGLDCDTGNITDCNDSLATHQNASEIMPNGCEDKLIFGQNEGLCGAFCKQDSDGHVITRRSENKILRSGWTIYTRLDLIVFRLYLIAYI